MDSLTLALARGAQQIGRTALPASAEHAARRCLLDWFAATLGGSVSPLAAKLESALGPEFGAGSAHAVGSGQRCPPRTAALLNGTLAHAIEFDDIYSPGLYHPGAPVIAATLAAAQAAGPGAGDVLPAIVAGYEISNRVARTINPAHYRHFHTTGTVGALGAAVGAGVALGLDAARLAGALAHAASMAAGLQQAFRGGGDTKPLHAGRAAEAGLFAALAARAGLEGAPGMLDGDAGLGSAMSADVDWSDCAAGIGTEFTIEQTTVKNHGCCGHSFAALDALLALRGQVDIAAIEEIRIGTYAAAVAVVGQADPRTASEARFSLPYCAAAALEGGSVRLAAFSDEKLEAKPGRALAARVVLEVDAVAEAAFPAKRGAVVSITAPDHPPLSHRVPDRHGSPSVPLSDAALVDKLHELGDSAIGRDGCARLAEAVMTQRPLQGADELLAIGCAAPLIGPGRRS